MKCAYKKSTVLFFLMLIAASVLRASPHDWVVAKDGSGDFKTVQSAIDAVPDFRENETKIYIKNGVYKEKLVLPASKTNVTFIGENVKRTILTYDDYASKKNHFGEDVGTTGSSSFFLFGDDFTAKNITFQNSAGDVGQAVAVRVDGDRVVFVNCHFLGFQDTLYTHGRGSRQYYKNCYIEGTVDFIFGSSTAVFDNCTIYCKKDHGGGYVTAASTPRQSDYGYVFKDCRITGNAPNDSFYLGRPWRPYARVVFMHSQLANFIKPAGWLNWHDTDNKKTAFYAEYKNEGPGYIPEKRVDWSHQLSEKEAAKYTLEHIFNGWDPIGKTK